MHSEYGWEGRSEKGYKVKGLKQLILKLNIHDSTYRNLRRGLENLRRLPFLVPHAPDNPVKRILEYLDRGINVILEFGRFDDFAAYILVANLLSRRIYAQYRRKRKKRWVEMWRQLVL